jgi:hypothetical protein
MQINNVTRRAKQNLNPAEMKVCFIVIEQKMEKKRQAQVNAD